MNLEEVYQFYGNITQAADAVNVSRQTFHNWMRKGLIPYNQEQRYEKLSNGKLKATGYPEKGFDSSGYIPTFRYWSDTLGMCDVHSLTYMSDRAPRIRYYDPVNRQVMFASFDVEKLMLATSLIDDNKRRIFERDFVRTDSGEFNLLSVDDYLTLEAIAESKSVLIIGNTFEGHKDGHKRSK